MNIRAKNWSEFQHYKDRSPVWIKLHKRLLDDRAFHALPDASRALAPMLWLLCSESDQGEIRDAIAEISFRLRMTEKKAEEALKPLIEAGFFVSDDLEQVASTSLADCEQVASLEKRREEERRERASALSHEQNEEVLNAFAEFVLTAQQVKWPTPRNLDPDRKKKLRARLDEYGIEGWRKMIAEAKASAFLTTKFPLQFDWVLKPANFRKVIEGNYRNGAAEEPPRKVVGWN